MKALSLFSGIGGIDLAGEWAGIETVAFCEREPFCQKVLKKHWPDIPIYDDVKELTKERLEADGIIGPGRTIDLIHGGYPCQPFSLAGKREGTEDDRHLWPEVFRLIQTLQPWWFVGENVAGHVTLGLDIVLSDLESIGYAWESFIIPACAVNALHRRDRVFIVAHSDRTGRKKQHLTTEPTGQGQHSGSDFKDVANTDSKPEPQAGSTTSSIGSGWEPRDDVSRGRWRNEPGIDWWATEPDVGRKIDGFSRELDSGGIDAKKARSIEIMRTLRSEYDSEGFRGAIRRLNSIQKTEILLLVLCELKEIGIDETWLQLESTEAFERIMRSLRSQKSSSSSPHKSGQNEQRAREYTDAMQVLSRFLAQYGPKTEEEYRWPNATPILNAWGTGWEDGIPRVANGVSNRVDRLKALGNAVVPQQIYPILAAIKQIDDMLKGDSNP